MTALDDMIARLDTLGEGGREAIAKEAAPLVMAASRATAAAGTDPYGTPWRPRKDGTRAIPDAASAVDAIARGPVIVIRAHRGAAIQNNIGRRVIPEAAQPLPAHLIAAIHEGARRVFERVVG